MALASQLITALLSFVSDLLTAYFDLWRILIQELLGDIFPGLADALCAFIDAWQDLVLGALTWIAESLVAALRL